MSIQSHLESAEESLRQALVVSLNEKDDGNLSDLFDLLKSVKRLSSRQSKKYNFELSSDFLDINKLGNVNIATGSSDVISFPTAASNDYSNIDLDLS